MAEGKQNNEKILRKHDGSAGFNPRSIPITEAHPVWAKLLLLLAALALPVFCPAQEPPYFVTYSDYMEEPGNLEITLKSANGTPKYGNPFASGTLEFEYGVKGWWTTEVYLAAQDTSNDSTIFTGWRWENRFRPLAREHFINPVFYFEYENVNQADRALLEITGHDSVSDLLLTIAQGDAVTAFLLSLTEDYDDA